MKEELSGLYSNLSDEELYSILKELKESEITGSFPEDSLIRKYADRIGEITGIPTINNLLVAQVGILKEGAFRWANF